VTPIPAIWLDGTLYFCVTVGGQKAKNLESNSFCVLTIGTNELRSGLDVVVEGDAARVTDQEQLQRLAALWKSKLDWDQKVAGDAFGDAEGRHAPVFGAAPTKVFAFTKGRRPARRATASPDRDLLGAQRTGRAPGSVRGRVSSRRRRTALAQVVAYHADVTEAADLPPPAEPSTTGTVINITGGPSSTSPGFGR
jgi:Pyridoxamine 5'-phosphate oxidase